MNNTSEIIGNVTSIVTGENASIIGSELVSKIGNLVTLFQAIGGLIAIYVLFVLVSLWFRRKRTNEMKRMRESLERIERKLSKVQKKKR